MGETIDLNDLSNIEESFTNVQMYGGANNNNRDFQPGAKVIFSGEEWEVVKTDEDDSEFLIVKRDDEEKRIYKQSVILQKEAPRFAPRSPDEPAPVSPDEEPPYGPRTPSGTPPASPDEEPPMFAPRSPDEEPPMFAPRSPDEEPPMFAPRSPDEEPPMFAPRSPDEEPPMFAPRSPDEPAPKIPEEPPAAAAEDKSTKKEDLITLLDNLQRENMPKIKLVKREELVVDSSREDTGVHKATNILLSRIHSEAREKYLRKFNEFNELIKKNKGDFTFVETATDITKLGDGERVSLTKPIYRNIQDLLSKLNSDLAAIEDELRQKRDAAIITPDPKLNKEIQELNETYKLYSQSLEIYHQYNSMVNKIPEKKGKMGDLLSLRNENRMEQIRLYSEIAEEMNKGAYDSEALNAKIQEYLQRGTREVEGELRALREQPKVETVVINDYNVEETSTGTEEPKPKKRLMKKKKKESKPKKSKDEILTEVLTTLEATEAEAEAAPTEAAPTEATEAAEAPAAEGNYEITLDSMIKGKTAVLDGKKQFKEEDVIREKCDESEECKGFTEKTYPDGKKKYFPRSTIKVLPAEDHKAFVKTGGATELGDEVKQLLLKEPEAEFHETREAAEADPEIKVIKISQPGGSVEKEQKPETPQEYNLEVEELNLGDDISELIQDDEPEYSFGDSYDSDDNDKLDISIPIEF